MKILLSLCLGFGLFLLAATASAQQPAAVTNDLANVPDTFYIPTNKVEWVCSAAILGPVVTNDVAYTVKNVQSNRCGVFVVSYPTKLPSPAPIILEILHDPDIEKKTFRLVTRKTPMFPGGQPGTPMVEMIQHVEVTFRAQPETTFYAYVNIGNVPFTNNRVMFGRISVTELDCRIKGGK